MHYHLKSGGVTAVIGQCLPVLLSDPLKSLFNTIVIVAGEIPDTLPKEFNHPKITITLEPVLGYIETVADTSTLENDLISFYNRYNNSQAVWWVHNHHLGKNPVFTKTLMNYINANMVATILHIHDFPENGRYHNNISLTKEMRISLAYENTPHSVFSVINTHDKNILQNSGVDVHLLPNIVLFQGNDEFVDADFDNEVIKKNLAHTYFHYLSDTYKHKDYLLFTYPVRCIRRKNVLEAGLLARMYEHYYQIPTLYCLTLAGTSSSELPYSTLVESLFQSHNLNGFFNIGNSLESNNLDFNRICMASNIIISSSVQEGFGFSYLNAVGWNVPLLARNISVTQDIAPLLSSNWPNYWYDSVHIPRSLFSREQIKELSEYYRIKILELSDLLSSEHVHSLSQQIENMFHSDNIDYSFLTIPMQYAILLQLPNILNELCNSNASLLTYMNTLVNTNNYLHTQRATIDRKHIIDCISVTYGKGVFEQVFPRLCNIALEGKAVPTKNSIQAAVSIQGGFSTLDSIRALYSPLSNETVHTLIRKNA